eukprot:27641_1
MSSLAILNQIIKQFDMPSQLPASSKNNNEPIEDETVHIFEPTIINQTLINAIEFTRLKDVLSTINDCDLMQFIDNIDINTVLNDYLYILQNHNNDDDFECIYNSLGGFCHMYTCNHFTRKIQYSSKIETIIDNINVKIQILDKIHCFYRHSYDLGYRLTSRDKAIIKKQNTTTNTKTAYIKKILSHKRHINNTEYAIRDKRGKKYCQLSISEEKSASCMPDTNNFNTYSYGYEFKYDYQGENADKDAIIVSPKFSSLKEELTINDIIIIPVEVFNNEYKKAQIYFSSKYRKQNYKTYEEIPQYMQKNETKKK